MGKRVSFALFLLVILLLLSSFALAQEDFSWIYKADKADLTVNVNTFFYRGSDVRDISAELTLYPENSYRQEVRNIETNPPVAEDFIFTWKKPADDKIEYSLQADVRTINEFKVIPKKIKFPVQNQENLEYTYSSKSIDSNNPAITELASNLAAGEDDLYDVVHKLASWVEQNVDYSLETVTEKSSKPASWVLENRKGVCDELTNLFIALARSLDIPARFVSGTAHTTNAKFAAGFGPHGWAEVYFPNYGWVPVDVTYRQVGWLDTSHISLKKSIDPLEPSIQYKWAGSDIDAGTINIDVSVNEYSEKKEDRFSLETNVLKKQTGFGSYNLIEARIKNNKGYYLPVEARVTISDSIELLEKNHKLLLLKPLEEKTVYWLFKTKEDLDPNFKYTSFFNIIVLGTENTAKFESVEQDRIFSLEEIKSHIIEAEKTERLSYSENIALRCSVSDDEFYTYEKQEVSCEIENKGSKEMKNMEFCFININCTVYDLPPGQKITKTFDYNSGKAEKKDLKFTVISDQVFKTSIIPINVLAVPGIKMELNFDENTEYNKQAIINFSISELTTEVRDVDVKVILDKKILQQTNIADFKKIGKQRFILRIPGSKLKPGKNQFEILFKYKDINGKEYEQEEKFEINLVNVTFSQKIKLFLLHLFS
ncbi:transglutaminase domain-containing protein [Candidatus Woesearchaeota archaeon]|nr:transglutaminase domain-containing protein [Candidatus Woesearchaeota archaeon]